MGIFAGVFALIELVLLIIVVVQLFQFVVAIFNVGFKTAVVEAPRILSLFFKLIVSAILVVFYIGFTQLVMWTFHFSPYGSYMNSFPSFFIAIISGLVLFIFLVSKNVTIKEITKKKGTSQLYKLASALNIFSTITVTFTIASSNISIGILCGGVDTHVPIATVLYNSIICSSIVSLAISYFINRSIKSKAAV